jgi:DNA-binding transcriptional regulator YhcF (GntR family)
MMARTKEEQLEVLEEALQKVVHALRAEGLSESEVRRLMERTLNSVRRAE